MSSLILQIHIKQWDKSQRSPIDVAARAAMPDRSPITGKPEFFILNRACLIDLTCADSQGMAAVKRPLKKALLADGSVKLERFAFSAEKAAEKAAQGEKLVLAYQEDNKEKTVIGDLSDGWIQAKYSWRYGVEQDGQIFWQYEEVTLNAACVDCIEKDYFLTTDPKLNFNAPE